MTRPNPTVSQPPRRRHQPRQQGSVLVLAVVLIVLLVMMGASYLQMARSDRRSTLQMDTRSQDYQDSILRYIGLTLAADVEFDVEFGDNPATPGTVETNFFRRWGAERHDYPFTWSDDSSIQPGAQLGITDLYFPVPPSARKGLLPQNAGAVPRLDDPTSPDTGATAQELAADDYFFAEGTGTGPTGRSSFDKELENQLGSGAGLWQLDRGQNDDMWLASTEPQFGGTRQDGVAPVAATGAWPHLSNLTGVFIDLGRLDANNQPTVYISTADNDLDSGDSWIDLQTMQTELSNVSPAPIRFADADGDGIADSRWTFAPVGGDAGLTYVMAVRIVDNSAKVNLNVASHYLSTPANIDQFARWYTPGDLFINPSFTFNVFDPAAAAGAALTNLFANPGPIAGVRDMATPTTFQARTKNYLLINQSYGNRASVLPPKHPWDAVGTGLQQLAQLGTAGYTTGSVTNAQPVDSAYTGSPEPLSPINEAELTWRNGLNRTSPNNTATAAADVESRTSPAFWRDGEVATEYSAAGFGSIQQYFEQNPRLRFTTISGSGDFDTLNLNLAETDEIRDFLESLNETLQDGGLLADQSGTLGGNFNFLATSGVGTWNNFTDLAAAFWSDWRDNDRGNETYAKGNAAIPELTQRGPYYGMEYLPFISEVYLKAQYQTTGTPQPSSTAHNDIPGPADDVDWQRAGNFYALAVEIVNPWNRPIPIADLELALEDPANPNALVATQSFGSIRNNLVARLGRQYLEANEVVTVHVGDFSDPLELGELDTVVPNANRVPAPSVPTWPDQGSQWDLGPGWNLVLFARDNANDPIPYQRFAVPTIPANVTERYPQGTVPANLANPGFVAMSRVAVIGTAAGLQMLTVTPRDLQLRQNWDTPFPGRDDTVSGTSAGQTVDAVMEDQNALAPPTEEEFGNYAKVQTSPDAPPFNQLLDTRVTGVATVSGTAGAATVTTAPGDEPFLIGNAGQFYRATDVFRVVYLGPQDDGTDIKSVAEVWREAPNTASTGNFNLRDFMIDADPRTSTGVVGGGPRDFVTDDATPLAAADPAHLQTTFPAFLLDRLSTFSPGSDNLDNDGDGQVDDPDERLVPGRINLNTVPASLLRIDRLTQVIPPSATFTGIATPLEDVIRRARDYTPTGDGFVAPGQRQASSRTAADHGLGIASMSHLMDLDMVTAAGDVTSRAFSRELVFDFNEYESDINANTLAGVDFDADGHINDTEERLAAIGAMKQLFDVRSDVYTAYILVRGYPANDFSGSPIEEYTITATFDRSVVHETRPLPRLVSVSIRRKDGP